MSREIANLSSNCHGVKDSQAVDLNSFNGRFLRSKTAEVVKELVDGAKDVDGPAGDKDKVVSREVAQLHSNCYGSRDSVPVDLSSFEGRFLRSKANEVGSATDEMRLMTDVAVADNGDIQKPALRSSSRLLNRMTQNEESPAKKARLPSTSTSNSTTPNQGSSNSSKKSAIPSKSRYDTIFNINNNVVASEDWVAEFLKYEDNFQAPSKREVIICKNGGDFNKIFNAKGGFDGFEVPYVIENVTGLGFNVDAALNVPQIVKSLGREFTTNAYLNSDRKYASMKMGEFNDLWVNKQLRKQPVNLLQLEVGSNPMLDAGIGVPTIFEHCSIQQCYDIEDAAKELKNCAKPSIKKFCLVTMAQSFTDFHVDFSGTSFWFFMQEGEKLFYIIPPTDENLEEYQDDEENGTNVEWLGDRLKTEIRRIHLRKGQMLFVPSGYLHAVYTPCDSLVFGGSIFSLPHLEMQLKITGIETRLRIKEVMPHLAEIYFAIAKHLLLPKLKSSRNMKQEVSARIRRGTNALIGYLNGIMGRNLKRRAIVKELEEEYEHHKQD
ncbi:unnamed protein product [Caenorhabditis angaria]|uniref:JmjC domain-containing protein n=1 Tax=Caenorhabditis angaria TaxID=860376 RepID=A0A9P1J0G8_9PELO|nr:unnamed protein product [Caenorhabditis angaria]